jgi:hypothetical protein
VTTRRTWATGPLLVLAGLIVGLVLAGPAGAAEPGPAYPPGAGADDVVQTGGGTGHGGNEGTAPAGAADDGGSAGDDPVSGSDGAGGADDDDADVGDPVTIDRPETADDTDAPAADEETAADPEATSDEAAPGGGGRGAGPILIVVGTAVLLGGAVVAIARRI